ncbi:zinc finger protein with KRAB and SCAN domains 5 [Culicoides brevitarsis]|uniref:zinc finger protein with KRAB and SCAN domains 5 n=1 Tax=Culicoides brevitarsis TaxID=469753 RepID=UPI00307C93B2
MNFSPFSTHFPGIHQFVSTTQENNSGNNQTRYNTNTSSSSTSNNNTNNLSNNFNQTKFRNDLETNVVSTNNIINKYVNQTATTAQYGTVSYSQPNNDTKSNLTLSNSNYQITNNLQMKDNVIQQQHSDLTQDITALLQQTDTKRVLQNVNTSWQTLTTPATSVADYLSHLPASTLPLSLHHFLKYSAENIKKETQNPLTTIDISQTQTTTSQINLNNLTSSLLPSTTSIANIIQQQHQLQQNTNLQNIQVVQNQVNVNQGNASQVNNTTNNVSNTQQQVTQATTPAVKKQKKKKKKPPKERKPRLKPGEVRLTTALDGSTLYECPDCQVCYPERGILEQHMIGHNLERKFVCDVCNAGLKRKDHLTRHKQSHNPQRPFICTFCMKGFKRKEQLTLHAVIHSGEKRHVCSECGKGFYRKDHLRKHTRSHIARRLKAELNQGQPGENGEAQDGAQTNVQQIQNTNGNIQQQQGNGQQQHLNNIQQSLIQQQIVQAQQLQAQLQQHGQIMS